MDIIDSIPNTIFNNSSVCTSCDEMKPFLDVNGITVFHSNIRGIKKNFDNFLLSIKDIIYKLDIIILSESWYDTDLPYSFSIPGFDFYHTRQKINQNSGITAFIKSSFNANVEQISIEKSNCLKIDISIPNTNDLTIFGFYRTGESIVDNFITALDEFFSSYSFHHNSMLIGDINLDIREGEETVASENYLDVLGRHNFVSCISQPTRTNPTNGKQTCIDHIMFRPYRTNDLDSLTTTILQTDITDHFSIAGTLQFNNPTINVSVPDRDSLKIIRNVNYERLENILSTENWDDVLQCTDVNIATRTFCCKLREFIDDCTETNTLSAKIRPIKPWMNPSLVLSIRNRDRLARQVKKYPTNDRLKQYYKRVKNIVTSCIRAVKDKYYEQEIKKNENDPKKLWKVIHNINETRSQHGPNIKTLLVNDNQINCETDKQSAASAINHHFSGVGINIAREISQQNACSNSNTIFNLNINHEPDAVQSNNEFCKFNATNSMEISNIIMKLKNNCSPGHDGIQVKVLKIISHFISVPLSYLINLSFDSAIFPDYLKTAVITPIYKGKGKKTDLQNYRPISVLSNIGKIFEKIVNNRLEEYLTKNNIITPRQFGFRKGVGTEDALIELTSHLYDQLDKHKKLIAGFLDIRKAYDSIDHNILLTQLNNIGLKHNTLQWFKTYLTDRQQMTKLTDFTSQPITCPAYSIPQGTILGPVLFNIYINNLPKVSKGLVFCYADDACIIYSGNDWTSTFNIARQDLTNLHNWYHSMSLQLNLTKTNYMTFSINSAGQPSPNTHLEIPSFNNRLITLDRVQDTRYLGVQIDQHLKWTAHTRNVIQKLRHLMYVFSNLRRVCGKKIIRMVYHALAQSLLQYCICSWGAGYDNTLNPLRRTQNILLRIILHKDRLFPTDELYSILNVFTLTNIYFYKLTLYSIKYQHKWTVNTNPHNTRQHGQIQTRKVQKSLTYRHFIYLGPKLFNTIPTDLKQTNTLLLLKYKTKEWIKTKTFNVQQFLPIS